MKISNLEECTTAGSVASVAQPFKAVQQRAPATKAKGSNLLKGIKTSKKFVNSISEGIQQCSECGCAVCECMMTENEAAPNTDQILYALTDAARHIANSDAYGTDGKRTISALYDMMRTPLKAGDLAGFEKAYEYCLRKYPDEASELIDTMYQAAKLGDQGTYEEFMSKMHEGADMKLWVREAQSLGGALNNALSKVEPGSKLDQKIKTHNRQVKSGVKDKQFMMTSPPEGYHFKKDGSVALGEGAKVDRMVGHVKSSEKKLGKSAKEAENIAWATANKRGMLNNKNKKKDVAEGNDWNGPLYDPALKKGKPTKAATDAAKAEADYRKKQKAFQKPTKQQGVAEGSSLGYTVIVRGNDFSYSRLKDALSDGHPSPAKVYKNGKFLGTIGSLSNQGVAEGFDDNNTEIARKLLPRLKQSGGSTVDKCAALAAKYFNSAGLQSKFFNIDEYIKQEMAKEGVSEGRFVKGPGGVPLDRQGNAIPPKVAAPKVVRTAVPKMNYDKIWFDVTNIISQFFPDGDPADYLPKYCRQHGLTYDDIRKAARKNGYKDEYDYIDQMKTGDYGYNELAEGEITEDDVVLAPGTGRRLKPGLLHKPEVSINPTDTVKLDVPLLIRLLEFAKEDAVDDMALHDLAEKLVAGCQRGRTLSMKDYDRLVPPKEAPAELAEFQEPMSKEEYLSRRKALQQVQMDPTTSRNPALKRELVQKIAALKKRAQDAGLLPKDTDEGVSGAIAGGIAGAMLTKSPSGAISGANIGNKLQNLVQK